MESLTLTGDSVEDILGTVHTTDVDWNTVLWMCHWQDHTGVWTSAFASSVVRQDHRSEEDDRL